MTPETTVIDERPIIFSGPMIRAILAGTKTQTRRAVTRSTSTSGYQRQWPAEGLGDARPIQGILAEECLSLPKPPGTTGGVYYGPDGTLEPRVWCRWQVGWHLWVRETWMPFERTATVEWKAGVSRVTGEYLPGGIGYRADLDTCGQVPVTEHGDTVCRTPKDRWRSPIFMPRLASRLTLEITDVRVQRVQEIGWADAVAEGVESPDYLAREEWEASVAPPGSVRSTPLTEFKNLWDALNAKRGFGWDTNPWVWALTFAVVHPD